MDPCPPHLDVPVALFVGGQNHGDVFGEIAHDDDAAVFVDAGLDQRFACRVVDADAAAVGVRVEQDPRRTLGIVQLHIAAAVLRLEPERGGFGILREDEQAAVVAADAHQHAVFPLRVVHQKEPAIAIGVEFQIARCDVQVFEVARNRAATARTARSTLTARSRRSSRSLRSDGALRTGRAACARAVLEPCHHPAQLVDLALQAVEPIGQGFEARLRQSRCGKEHACCDESRDESLHVCFLPRSHARCTRRPAASALSPEIIIRPYRVPDKPPRRSPRRCPAPGPLRR